MAKEQASNFRKRNQVLKIALHHKDNSHPLICIIWTVTVIVNDDIVLTKAFSKISARGILLKNKVQHGIADPSISQTFDHTSRLCTQWLVAWRKYNAHYLLLHTFFFTYLYINDFILYVTCARDGTKATGNFSRKTMMMMRQNSVNLVKLECVLWYLIVRVIEFLQHNDRKRTNDAK